MIETNIKVHLDRYDGPLGLLLHLVQKEEMDVRELDINRITNQYLDYIHKLADLNFDVAGEYLFMAASLLYIKSQNCITENDKKENVSTQDLPVTTKAQLIQKLEQLQRFQAMGERLWTLPRKNEDIFVKPKVDRKSIQNSILTPMDLQSLTNVMIDLIRKEKRKYTVVKRDKLSIKEKLLELKRALKQGSQTTMDNLIDKEKGNDDVVITFISLLELARLKKLEIFQNDSFGEIYVNVKDDLENFDVEVADGFDPEDEAESISDEDILNASGPITQDQTNTTEQVVTLQ